MLWFQLYIAQVMPRNLKPEGEWIDKLYIYKAYTSYQLNSIMNHLNLCSATFFPFKNSNLCPCFFYLNIALPGDGADGTRCGPTSYWYGHCTLPSSHQWSLASSGDSPKSCSFSTLLARLPSWSIFLWAFLLHIMTPIPTAWSTAVNALLFGTYSPLYL